MVYFTVRVCGIVDGGSEDLFVLHNISWVPPCLYDVSDLMDKVMKNS